MSREGRVRVARMQETDRVAALWALITEHHAGLDSLFRMRSGPEAEGELRELLRALARDPDAAIDTGGSVVAEPSALGTQEQRDPWGRAGRECGQR